MVMIVLSATPKSAPAPQSKNTFFFISSPLRCQPFFQRRHIPPRRVGNAAVGKAHHDGARQPQVEGAHAVEVDDLRVGDARERPALQPPLRLVQPHAQFELAPLRDRVDLAAPGVDAQYVRRVEQLRLAAAKAGQFPLRPARKQPQRRFTSSVIRGAVITARASAQFGSMRTSTFMAVPLSSPPVITARAASASPFRQVVAFAPQLVPENC